MLALIVLIVLILLGGYLLLFGMWGAVLRLFGLFMMLCGAAVIALLYYVQPPRTCQNILSVEPLIWESSPFKADTNFVGDWQQDGFDYYAVKVIDDYGSPHMMKIKPCHIVFLGTTTKEVTLLRYDITGWGLMISLSWLPRYVLVMNSDIISTGENDLMLKGVPVYHFGKKGISPELKRRIGSDDDDRLLGLAEAPLQEVTQ